MEASQPHGVAATTSSSSISLQMESGSAPPLNHADLVDFLGLELIDSRVSLEELHWRSYIGEFGVGAESIAAGCWLATQCHGPTSSASTAFQMDSGSAPPPKLTDLVNFLGLESIDSRASLEELHWRSYMGEVTWEKSHWSRG